MISRFVCAAIALSFTVPVLAVPHESASTSGASGIVTVGDPAHPEMLPTLVLAAYQRGARRIAVRPGVYNLPKLGTTAFQLNGWQNCVLGGYGVTIVQADCKWNDNAVTLKDCENVSVQGFTLSQTEVTAYQGKVLDTGQLPDGSYFADWRPDAGYPVPPAGMTDFPSAINVIDANTHLLKVGNGDYYRVPAKDQGDGTFRFQFEKGPLRFGVGDWLVGRSGNPGFKVCLENDHDCTVRDVTMMRNGFAAIREEGGGGNHIVGCRWALGPKPDGGTENPLVSGSADGLHSTGANPGPDIEGCNFDGVLLDDCIAIHGGFQEVKSWLGQTLTVTGRGAGLKVGEPARICSDHGLALQATVTAISPQADGSTLVTIDKATASTPEGKVMVTNPLTCGPGYKIIGNHLGNTRSRGLLLKGDYGLVENNVITGCGMAAVSLGPEFYWHEAGYVNNVTVKGNDLEDNGGAGYGGAAILVHGDGAIGNSGIVIHGNRLHANYQGDIEVHWTSDVMISENLMAPATPPDFPMTPRPAIFVQDCEGVSSIGNRVAKGSGYPAGIVVQQGEVGWSERNMSFGVSQGDALVPPPRMTVTLSQLSNYLKSRP